MFLWGRCYFLLAQKVTKDAPRGLPSMNTSPKAGVHRRRPPGPPFTGAGRFGPLVASGGLNFDRASLYSRPTGAYQSKIYRWAALTHTAWCIPTCWVRRWSCGRTARPIMDQLPQFCPGRRCPYNADTSKFLTRQGPVSPGQEGPDSLVFAPPDEISYFPGGRPP